MDPTNFVYWIQGLLELSPDLKTLNEAQVKMIRDHLGYVFTHMEKAATPAWGITTAPVAPLPTVGPTADPFKGYGPAGAGGTGLRDLLGQPIAIIC